MGGVLPNRITRLRVTNQEKAFVISLQRRTRLLDATTFYFYQSACFLGWGITSVVSESSIPNFNDSLYLRRNTKWQHVSPDRTPRMNTCWSKDIAKQVRCAINDSWLLLEIVG